MNLPTEQERDIFLYKSNTPLEYHSGWFNTIDTDYIADDRVKAVADMAKDRKWLAFMGQQAGIGKTLLACRSLEMAWLHSETQPDAVGNKSRHHPEQYQFYSVRNIAMRLCLSGVGYQDEFDKLNKLKAIVIDEFGSEGGMHPNAKERVLNLIWDMYDRNRMVILTSPISTIEEIENQYGGGLVSRIQQRGSFMLLSGQDYRLKG
jgi:hypothetical protein|tara:strand:+ start:64 stop:678 length:615 start_codon:yes stop_codon:yes gene_type:complete